MPDDSMALPTIESMALPTIEGYKIHRRLGSGGMGQVLLATRLRPPSRLVAIKLLLP